MMKRIALVVGAVALACALTLSARAEERFNSLLARVPGDANALMLMDVDSLLATDMADKLGWSVALELHAQARDIMIPPSASMVVRSSHYDVASKQGLWDLSVLQLKHAPDVARFAAAEGGRTDTIGKTPVVWSPRDFYGVDLGANAAAIYAPASRQQVNRWLQDTAARKAPALSSFLTQTVKSADLKATQLLLAMDLEGIVSAREIKPDLAGFKAVQQAGVNIDKLADAIASIRGVSLAVGFADKAQGTLTVSFAQDVSFMQPIARDLVIQVLRNQGMLVIEVQNWEATAQGTTITMAGPLFSSGLRRITSFFDAPAPHVSTAAAEPSQAQPERPTTASATAAPAAPVDPVVASQQYYKAVTAYLDDVYKAESADSSQLGDAALWMQKYARKIEQLPIANVDERLLDWSAYVSAQLVQCSNRLKDVRLQSASRMAAHSNFYDMADTGGSPTTLVGVRSSGRDYSRAHTDGYHYDNNNYNYSSYSGTDVYEVQTKVDHYRQKYQEGERKQIGIEEKASGAHDALAIMAELRSETAKVRRDMTTKYNVEF